MNRIAVIDGQGGGIGSFIMRKIKETYGETIEIWALGTNSIATSQMMKARANRGGTGEAAICHCVHQVDVIIGSTSILVTNAMMGEITGPMVEAIGASRAVKLLLPLTREAVVVVGATIQPLPHLVDELISLHLPPVLKLK